MPRYEIERSFTWYADDTVVVEAENEDQAIAAAMELEDYPSPIDNADLHEASSTGIAIAGDAMSLTPKQFEEAE